MVSAAGAAVYRDVLGVELQQRRARLGRISLLLLVPDGVDPDRRWPDLDRLFRDPAIRPEPDPMPIDWVALLVFVLLFGFITVLGFVAVRWRRGDLGLLHEWGLAGSRFGTVVTWFLLGGDLYTAYTFIAVPALLFGVGALGFFAVPYTTMVYPFVFVVFPRLWSVARRHGYITAADFVRGRYGSRWLALAVAVTGIVATMPYIALQLVGIQVVIAALGVEVSCLMRELP